MNGRIELLAPAGEPEAGYAALHYGADAIYLGLNMFSARAEAVNLSFDDLDGITAYAHSLLPRRKVFVTVNTVILQDELQPLISLLADVADIGVDAVIVQDLGVVRILRRHFPELRIHASTQMAIHNLDGARAAGAVGAARVTLARELSLKEIQCITKECGLETEVFVHGALCYSYSGLCLFSSFSRGMSGNRGRCKYACRDFCRLQEPLKSGFGFSMKDLALRERVLDLRDSGVASLKIEGRMKSPLYVATVVNYYRRLLDGALSASEAHELEAQMQTVFSRPWTRAFIDSPSDQDVVDRDVVGHRGARIGQVERIGKAPAGFDTIVFVSNRPIERHDGIQVDVPGAGEPFGFPVDSLNVQTGSGWKSAFEVPAGSRVDVGLPPGHPVIPVGSPVYCSSSQAVKRSYPYDRPKPGLFRVRRPLDVALEVTSSEIKATTMLAARNTGETELNVSAGARGEFTPAKNAAKTAEAVVTAFRKLGNTSFAPGKVVCSNPDGLFVAVSLLNDLRRKVVNEAEMRIRQEHEQRVGTIRQAVLPDDQDKAKTDGAAGFSWSIKVDRVEYLSAFESADLDVVCEVIVDIANGEWPAFEKGLEQATVLTGRERIRLALPVVTREADEKELRRRIRNLLDAGWRRWQVSNLSGWGFLGLGSTRELNVTADAPLHVLNRQAALQLLDMGLEGFTLSVEDSRDNMKRLLAEFGDKAAVVVHQDIPLFISASCLNANLKGGCRKGQKCRWGEVSVKMEGGEKVIAIQNGCGTVVVSERPFSIASRAEELREMGAVNLRADFTWRHYAAESVLQQWRAVRAGEEIGLPGNFERGLA